jgi:hypothetical protein
MPAATAMMKMRILLDASAGTECPAVFSGATSRVTVSTAMVGAFVPWRFKNSLAASASAKTEVLKISSMAALADESVVTMVISTRVDAA